MKRVLFVDDDADVRDLVAGALRLEGYQVETAADGGEASLCAPAKGIAVNQSANGLMKRVRCVTRGCNRLVSIEASNRETDQHGKWQFQCPFCSFWNLASSKDAVQATSRTAFELSSLPRGLQDSGHVARSEPGGIDSF